MALSADIGIRCIGACVCMYLPKHQHLQLCYQQAPLATNLEALYQGLLQQAVPLKHRLAEYDLFGISLSLSDALSRSLLEPEHGQALHSFLNQTALHLLSLHSSSEKQLGDWRSEARLHYSLRLLDILGGLLPDVMEGSIDTVVFSRDTWHKEAVSSAPVSNQAIQTASREARESSAQLGSSHSPSPTISSATNSIGDTQAGDTQAGQAALQQASAHLMQCVAALWRWRQRGKVMYLGLEPSANSLLSNSQQLCAFFQDYLLQSGADSLAESLHISPERARQLVQEHVRICFDASYFASRFESAQSVLENFSKLGIRLAKLQLSAALCCDLHNAAHHAEISRRLRLLAQQNRYVVQRDIDAQLQHFPDIASALEHLHNRKASEWRIDMHLPLYFPASEAMHASQSYIQSCFRIVRSKQRGCVLEIESHPSVLINEEPDWLESREREYRWVLHQLDSL